MTRQQIRDNIYLQVKPKPSEDDNLYDRHIDAIIDDYRAFFIAKEVEETDVQYIDPSIITSYTNKTATAVDSLIKGYKTFSYTLPSSVISLPQDMGVYNVSSTAGKRFKRIDRKDVERFSRLPQASLDCTYYRIADKLYFIKKDAPIVAPTFDIDLVLGDTLGTADDYIISDTDYYPVSEKMRAMVIEAVVLKLKQAGEQISDYISDGVEE